MAVLNPKKLLPSSKDGVLAKVPTRPTFTPKYALVPVRNLKPESESKPSEKKVTLLNQVIEVKKKTISIEKIVDKNTKLYQKSEEKKRKLLERQKREKREKKLEEKKPDSKKEEKGVSVPGLGFLGGLKKFLIFTALGGLLGIVQKYIPDILGFLKFAGPVFQFIESSITTIVGGFTTFIHKSYQLTDAIRKEVENFGGDEALKQFNSFTKTFTRYANLAIMLFSAGIPGSTPIGPKGKIPGGKVPSGGKPGATQKRLSKFQLEQARKNVSAVKGPGIGPKSGATKGGIFRRGASRSLTRLQTNVIGRQNQLKLSRAARTFGNRASSIGGRLTLGGKLPIIGPIIMGYDSYMADADGDGQPDKNINKTLFVAGGSALGGLLAAGIPVIGPILGSVAGGYIGDLMYEMILGKGPLAAGERFKNDVIRTIKTSLGFGKHLVESAGRFFSYLPKVKFFGKNTLLIDFKKLLLGGFDIGGAFKAALFPETFSSSRGKTDFMGEEKPEPKPKDSKKQPKVLIPFPSWAGSSGASGSIFDSYESIDKKTTTLNLPKNIKDDKAFQRAVTDTAKRLGVSERALYAVMSFETGGTFDPAQKNLAGSGATGLIQFMPSTAEDLGTTTDELSRMSRAKQMAYVQKYFLNTGILKGSNLSDLYMAVLFPAAIGKSDDFVLFGKGATVPGYGEGSKAYKQNKGLDSDGSGSVTKKEASAKVIKELSRFAKGGKTKGGAHPIMVGEKGPEFVLDADTTRALEDNYPGFLDRINKADYKGSVDVLRNYASYYNPSRSILMYQRVFIEKTPEPQPYFA